MVESCWVQVQPHHSLWFWNCNKTVAPFGCFIYPWWYQYWVHFQVFLLFLNSSYSAYATHVGGTLYGFASYLTLSEKVPLKHPIPADMSLNSLCILIVVLPLLNMSVSMLGPATNSVLLINYFVGIVVINFYVFRHTSPKENTVRWWDV